MIVSNERVAAFIARSLGKNVVPPYVAIGTEIDGEIVNGVLLNHWEGFDIHVSVAGRAWSRHLIKAVGEYVFDRLLCERITIVTEQPKVMSIAQRLGAEVEGCLRNHFGPGRDAIVFGILKQDWRF